MPLHASVLAAGGAAGWLVEGQSLRALGCAEYDVGSQGCDAVRLQLAEDASPDKVPEPVRVVEVVRAGGGHHGRVLHAAVGEQVREGGLCGDLIPGVEGLEQ